MREIALYIHVPFCIQKCRYCDFVSYPYLRPESISDYFKVLTQELQIRTENDKLQSVVLKSIYFGEFKRAGGPLSSVTPFYSDQFESAQDYNPKRAQQLLDEAGWTGRDKEGYRIKNGKRLTVKVPLADRVSNAERALWEQIQASTKREGFEVNLEPMDSGAITKCCTTGWDYDIRLGYWNTNTPDVMRFIFSSAFIARPGVIYHVNGTGFSNTDFDETINAALKTQDVETRRELYVKAQKIISENYIQITTTPQSSRLAIYKTAKGVRLEPSLTVPYFYDAWVEK